MTTARRAFWELATVLALIAAILAVWKITDWYGERQLERLSEEHRAVSEAAAEAHRGQVAELREAFDGRLRELAEREAISVFEAFRAGIQTAAVARDRSSLASAKREILKLEPVSFAHLLTPSGRVLFSSDQKLTTAGRADERARWALAVTGVTTRASETVPGNLEIAGPIRGSRQVQAILWIGYDVAQLTTSGNP